MASDGDWDSGNSSISRYGGNGGQSSSKGGGQSNNKNNNNKKTHKRHSSSSISSSAAISAKRCFNESGMDHRSSSLIVSFSSSSTSSSSSSFIIYHISPNKPWALKKSFFDIFILSPYPLRLLTILSFFRKSMRIKEKMKGKDKPKKTSVHMCRFCVAR